MLFVLKRFYNRDPKVVELPQGDLITLQHDLLKRLQEQVYFKVIQEFV